MRHLLLAVCVLGLVAAPTLRADDESTKDGSRADQVKAIQEKFNKAQLDWNKEMQAAKPEDRRELMQKRPQPGEVVRQLQKIVAEDPKDDAAFDALVFILRTTRDQKAIDTLAEHHAANPKIVPVLTMAGQLGATKLLEAVLENNTDRKAQGIACLALGTDLHNQASRQTAKAEELDKKAEEYLTRVEKEFAHVEVAPAIGNRPAVLAGAQAEKILWEIRNLGIGRPVPEVISKDLDDQEVKLSDLKGKVVVLDFWATWCPPCRAMIPHSRKLVEKMKDKPFVLVSISSDAKKETLTEFIEKEPMPWTHWWEGTREDSVGRKWNITGIPTIYIVDAKGVIRYKQIGFNAAEPDKIDKQVEKLLEEMEKN